MIKIFDEKTLIENIHEGEVLHPSRPCTVLIQSGEIEFEVNNARKTYKSSELIVFSPMKMYRLIRRSDHIRAYFILYNRDIIKKRINVSFNKFPIIQQMNMETNDHIYSVPKEAFNRLWQTVEHLDFYLKNPNYSHFNEQIITHGFTIFTYLLADILLKNSPSDTEHNKRKEAITLDFIHLVTQHCTEERELKFYSDQLFISIKYLSICVKETTGIAAQVLISNTLADKSRLLLINTDLNIAAIADQLNFSDQFAFGKFFKKHTGLSPRNFRNAITSTHTI